MYTTLGIIFGLLVLIIIVLKIYRTKQQHRAASNVVFAKYTFEQIKKDDQKKVKEKAKALVLVSNNTKLKGFANEVERYGWYALAMKELGISSSVPDNPQWLAVKNPYTAILPGNYLLRAVSSYLLTEHNIAIDISEAKNYQIKKQIQS